MEPNQQVPSGQIVPQPTQLTGSEWQRQAVMAARAAAASQQQAVLAPSIQAARERAAAQDVPDMLAAVDPVPPKQPLAQQQIPPFSQQSAQAQSQPLNLQQPVGLQVQQGTPVGQQTAQSVVSGTLAENTPPTPLAARSGGASALTKGLIVLGVTVFVLIAATIVLLML